MTDRTPSKLIDFSHLSDEQKELLAKFLALATDPMAPSTDLSSQDNTLSASDVNVPTLAVVGKKGHPLTVRKTVKKNPGKRNNKMFLETHFVSVPKFPPEFDNGPTTLVRRRWVSNATNPVTNMIFALAQGHRQFLISTSSLTSAVPYVDTWRIRKISVWCINDVDHTTSVTIVPAGIDIDSNMFNDREKIFSCSSKSEAEPGRMAIVPAEDSPLGSWHVTSTVNPSGSLFVMNVNYGGASSGSRSTVTMDIDFETVVNVFGSPNGYSVVPNVAASNGSLGGAHLFSGGLQCFDLQNINVLV
jgi:hypothetical protein